VGESSSSSRHHPVYLHRSGMSESPSYCCSAGGRRVGAVVPHVLAFQSHGPKSFREGVWSVMGTTVCQAHHRVRY
jgi:hypothetical protein